MRTSKPLTELIPEILTHIFDKYESHVIYNKKLLDLYEGQSLKYIEEALSKELSPESYERSISRIPPINITKQLVTKMTGIYASPASRSLRKDNDIDQDLLVYAEEHSDFDSQMAILTDMLALHQYVAAEWYVVNDKPQLRVINATEFLPFSDSVENPNEMTVFIKFMGEKNKTVTQYHDQDGRALDVPVDVVKTVSIFRLYSETEFVQMDSEGEVEEYIFHNKGYIEQTYIKTSAKLIPEPSDDMLRMAILIPLMMTDINYFAQYATHSVMYGINLKKPTGMKYSPDAFWNFQSVEAGEGQVASSSIGTIKNDTDSGKLWENILNQLSMWLESKGLKTTANGKIDGSNTASGISKIIDESDASRVRKKFKTLLMGVEARIWERYKEKLRDWRATKKINSKEFSKDAVVITEFAEEKPLHDFNSVLDAESKLKDLGLTTKKLSLVRLFPNMTVLEIDDMLVKIEEEMEKNKTFEEVVVEKNEELEEKEDDNGSDS